MSKSLCDHPRISLSYEESCAAELEITSLGFLSIICYCQLKNGLNYQHFKGFSSSHGLTLGNHRRNGRKHNSMKDFLVSSRDSSPVRERAGLSLSAVKSLVRREKEDKVKSNSRDDEKVLSLIQRLFDAGELDESSLFHFTFKFTDVIIFDDLSLCCNIFKIFAGGGFLRRQSGSECNATSALNLARDIHGSPPGSFVVKVAEVIGSFKTMKKMALFWCRVVEQVGESAFCQFYTVLRATFNGCIK